MSAHYDDCAQKPLRPTYPTRAKIEGNPHPVGVHKSDSVALLGHTMYKAINLEVVASSDHAFYWMKCLFEIQLAVSCRIAQPPSDHTLWRFW